MHNISYRLLPLVFTLTLILGTTNTQPLHADATGLGTAPLKQDVPYIFVVHKGRSIKVVRNIEQSFSVRIDIRGELMQTSGACPPFCLQPIELDLPIKTVAEIEIIDFLLTSLRDNNGLLIDIRSPKQYKLSTIPGSANIFIQDLMKASDVNAWDNIFDNFGIKKRKKQSWFMKKLETYGLVNNVLHTENWDFTEAKDLIIWSTSATEPTPIKFIEILLATGYPAEKIKWYRGGLAAWQYWGFTTVSAPKR